MDPNIDVSLARHVLRTGSIHSTFIAARQPGIRVLRRLSRRGRTLFLAITRPSGATCLRVAGYTHAPAS